MSFEALYAQKRLSAHDAVRVVKNGDAIVVPTGVAEPPTLLKALSDQRREFEGVTVGQILPIQKYDYFDPETSRNVRHLAYFVGGPSRAGAQAGWIDYVPAYFSELPALIEQGLVKSDVVFSMASPMDKHGWFSLSLGPDYTMAAIKTRWQLPHPHLASHGPDRKRRPGAGSGPAQDRPRAGSHWQIRGRHDRRRRHLANRLRRHS